MTLLVITWIISLAVAVTYYKSSIQKFRNTVAFVQIVNEYRLFSAKTSALLAPLLIIIELLVCVWVILPWTRMIGSIVGALLQILFIFLMVKNFGKRFSKGCGCFKFNAPTIITLRHIIMNLGIFLALLFVIIVDFLS